VRASSDKFQLCHLMRHCHQLNISQNEHFVPVDSLLSFAHIMPVDLVPSPSCTQEDEVFKLELSKIRVLLLDDEKSICAAYVKFLCATGYQCSAVHTIAAAREHMAFQQIDVIIVDIHLPDGDGLEFVEALYRQRPHVGLIVMSADVSAWMPEKAINGGAAYFFSKTDRLHELSRLVYAVGRATVMLRRGEMIAIDRLTIDLLGNRARVDGTRLELPPRDFTILSYLARREGEVVSRMELMEVVWDEPKATRFERLQTRLQELRKTLERAGLPPLIHTVRSEGYILELRKKDDNQKDGKK
jgi:DNA-binding response OmpR family regulator